MSDTNLQRRLGLLPMLSISVGAIIGSAWLFAPLFVAQFAGPAGILSWVIAISVAMLLALVYAELGAAFPVAGGLARFSYFSHGNLAGFLAGFSCWLGYVAFAPIEVQAIIRYLADDWPWLLVAQGSTSLSGLGFIFASLLLLAMTAINLLGVSWFGETNKLITIWKVIVPVTIPVVLILHSFDGANFTDHGGFMPSGISGVFAAVSTGGAMAAMLGFRAAIEMAGEARNPKRDVPLALIGSVLITGGIYLLIQIGFVGALPTESLAKGWSALSSHVESGPFVELAAAAGVAWLIKLIFIDAVVSPAGCGLVFSGASARLVYAMACNDQLPTAFKRLDRRGVPRWALAINFLVGLAFFAPSQTWQSIVGFISSIQMISLAFGPASLLVLRRVAPNGPRPFRLPLAGPISLLAFFASNVIVYWCGWETNRMCFGLLAVAGVGFIAVRKISRSDEPLDLSGLRWLLPWLAVLTAVSWLGQFGGGTGTIPHGVDLAILAVTSLIILAVSQVDPTSRLPED